MSMFRSPVRLVGFLLAIGCTEEETTPKTTGSGESLPATVLSGEVAVYTDLCRCAGAIGQPDPTTCIAHFVGNGTRERTPSEAECVTGVFEEHSVEVDRILECELTVIATTRACLAKVANCEKTAVVQCATDGLTSNTACGAYPRAVQHGINECYGLSGDGAADSAP